MKAIPGSWIVPFFPFILEAPPLLRPSIPPPAPPPPPPPLLRPGALPFRRSSLADEQQLRPGRTAEAPERAETRSRPGFAPSARAGHKPGDAPLDRGWVSVKSQKEPESSAAVAPEPRNTRTRLNTTARKHFYLIFVCFSFFNNNF